MSFSSDSIAAPENGQQKLRIVVITGATRCGKTLLTEWLQTQSLRDSDEQLVVLHQDNFWRSPSEMPKVSLQGAPYIKVTYWDADECIDWSDMILHVEEQRKMVGEGAPTTLIIEGNMLLSQQYFIDIATEIVCISIDKWACFDRRVKSDSKRQCYLPYMIEMWKSHMDRFNKALRVEANRKKMKFVDNTVLVEVTKKRATSLQSALDVHLLPQCTLSLSMFDLVLNSDVWCPNTWKPIDVNNFNDIYSVPFAAHLRLMETSSADTLWIHSIYAMLLGNAYGDAAGAWCEFHHQKKVVWDDGLLNVPLILSGRGGVRGAPPGAVTDDFQMTLLALKTLIKNDMKYKPRDHAMAYIDWASKHPGGIGTNTRELFQHPPIKDKNRTYEKYLEKHAARHADKSNLSKSNGTLMRASAFAAIKNFDEAVKAAVADAGVSNDNTVSKFSNAIYVAIIHNIVNNRRNSSQPLKTWVNNDFLNTVQQCMLAAELASNSIVDTDSINQVRGVVLNAVGSNVGTDGDMSRLVHDKEKKGFVLVALWVALRFYETFCNESLSLKETIRQVVCLGGDTDTNAAITGALICSSMSLAPLCHAERENLNVLFNCQYDYSTVKNIDNLRPSSLPKVMVQLFNKVSTTPMLQQQQEQSSTENSPSTSVGSKSKRNSDDDDNDDGDDDDDTESFNPETVRKQKQQKLKK